MLEYALGMIETRGLVASIEAADVMCKTANVHILGTEYIRNGLVTVKIIGEVAAVKAAVEAGGAAASKVGQLITTHVIPRPAEEVESILKKVPPRAGGVDAPAPHESKEASPTVSDDLFVAGADGAEFRSHLEAMTVHQLRTLARNTGGLGIAGRQISRANKELLITELMKKRTSG